eukprot:TRINITY_DN19960_c0_g1_i1.p1 TRINITY_DN19960_c0_g1~~TRINITY_DN19960_c0_g1_i1.p1  ORF type:complete len:548 (-),score=91.64 TRINITY_DN19960_c0_g1_i1:37-1680(-)
MSAAPAGSSAAATSRCAECGNVLSDALVLSCGHDLCLTCAASALRQTRSLSGRMVRCLLCPSVTELCEEAARTLAEVGKSAPSNPPPAQFAEPVGSYNHGCSNHPHVLPHPQGAPQSAWNHGQGGLSGTNGFAPHAQQQPRSHLHPGNHDGRSGAHHQNGRDLHIVDNTLPGLQDPPRSRPVSPRAPRPVGASVTPVATSGTSQQIREDHRCPEHPDEPATYFCATCECACICAECVIQKNGRHRNCEVLRVGRAHEVLRSRAGALLDEAVSLEDDFAMVGDRLSWRRKDIERAAARGRASVRSAFSRVRAQLNEREAELLESLDAYESDSLNTLDLGGTEHSSRLNELRRLQDNLRSRCRNSGDAVEALNTYSAAKSAIASLREAFRQEEFNSAGPPEEFVGLAGSARAELDLHAEGLASLEEAVASLCEKGVEFPAPSKAQVTISEPVVGGYLATSSSSTAVGASKAQNASAAAAHLLGLAAQGGGTAYGGEANPPAQEASLQSRQQPPPLQMHGQQHQRNGYCDYSNGRISAQPGIHTQGGRIA